MPINFLMPPDVVGAMHVSAIWPDATIYTVVLARPPMLPEPHVTKPGDVSATFIQPRGEHWPEGERERLLAALLSVAGVRIVLAFPNLSDARQCLRLVRGTVQ